ncbi:AraC-like ligand-binding domain-containing protein [Roseibium sp. M-1]
MMAEGNRRQPLNRFRSFATTDVDEAREIVARHFCNHRLGRFSAGDSFDACQNRVAGHGLSLNYLRYGADVSIDPGELSGFYLIQIPLAGAASVRNGSQCVQSTPKVGSILNPDRGTTMRWHAGCEQVLLQVDRKFLQQVAERIAGMQVGPVRFQAAFDLQGTPGSLWRRRLCGAFAAAEEGQAFQGNDLHAGKHLEEGLVISLLYAQPSTVTPLLQRRDSGSVPAILKRAVSLINERYPEDLGLLDLSAEARTTPRNLQILFKREYGVSPLRYLQEVRLNVARHLLLSEGAHLSIADIADRSGHRHPGRFAQAYKARFGEAPRETRQCLPFE